MTNGEKYLKDGVSAEEFAQKLHTSMCSNPESDFSYKSAIITFLKEQTKPTLTEDERVILRNIDKDFINIGRTTKGSLYVQNDFQDVFDSIDIYYNHLFQFIKNGEEYEIEELLGDE